MIATITLQRYLIGTSRVMLAWLLLYGIWCGQVSAQTGAGKTPKPGLGPVGGAYKALLIGIDSYANGWSELHTPELGARALEPVLRDQYGFKVQKMLGNEATRRALFKKIQDFLMNAEESDSLLLYFSGHGAIDEAGVSYWIPIDAEKGSMADGLSKSQVQSWVIRSPARHVLLVVDACYGAGIAEPKGEGRDTRSPPRSTPEYLQWMRARSREALTAGGKELVEDRLKSPALQKRLEGHTPFTYFLLQSLDKQPSAYFASEQLYTDVKRGSEAFVEYMPRLLPLDMLDGGFVFVRQGGGQAREERRIDSAKGESTHEQVASLPGGAARVKVSSNIGGALWLDDKLQTNLRAWESWSISSGPGTFRLLLKGACEDIGETVRISEAQLGGTVSVSFNGTPGLVCTRLPQVKGSQHQEVILWQSVPGTGPDGFMMGSPDNVGDPYERPQHKVKIPAFQMSKTEVTNAQYNACVAAGKCTQPSWDSCYAYVDTEWKEGKVPDSFKEDNKPVVCVDWFQARAYAAWVTKVSGQCVRLPTEAEWEYVGTGGGKTKYAGTDDQTRLCEYGNVADKTSKDRFNFANTLVCKDGYAETAPVGQFADGAWGLKDLTGNVWEWTEDCWHANYKDAPEDGSAWLTGCLESDKDALRVVRGGAWFTGPGGLRSSLRDRVGARRRDFDQGFRLAAVSFPPCRGLPVP